MRFPLKFKSIHVHTEGQTFCRLSSLFSQFVICNFLLLSLWIRFLNYRINMHAIQLLFVFMVHNRGGHPPAHPVFSHQRKQHIQRTCFEVWPLDLHAVLRCPCESTKLAYLVWRDWRGFVTEIPSGSCMNYEVRLPPVSHLSYQGDDHFWRWHIFFC